MITPKKNSINKSLGGKALDTAKYVGKNFWKVLPFGSALNYYNKRGKAYVDSISNVGNENYEELREKFEKITKFEDLKKFLHHAYSAASITALGTYLFTGFTGVGWTPEQWKEHSQQQKEEIQYLRDVQDNYESLLENAASFEDSVRIFEENGFPTKLKDPTLNDKARVFNE